MTTRVLERPKARILAGVCAGLGEHLGVKVSTVRIVMSALVLAGGAGALLYIWLWLLTPSASDVQARRGRDALLQPSEKPPVARGIPVAEILFGVALLAAGIAFVAARLGADVPLAFLIPAIVVLTGIGFAWTQFSTLRWRGQQGRMLASPPLTVRSLGALALVGLGILLFFVTQQTPNMWTVIAAAVSVLLGVAVVATPWILRLVRDLSAERAAREREAERADIAAHLHDSVLQSLALIQQKSESGSEVARIARAQERELREWLFADRGKPVDDLVIGDQIKRIAHELEADFPVRFEVVVVGEQSGPVPEPLVAAAGEAMLNAARHAGGEVSVYLETAPEAIELIVTDRGPGFSLDAIGSDRLGVRESIIGRMTRAGGTATIAAPRAHKGTQITLRVPLAAPVKEGEQER